MITQTNQPSNIQPLTDFEESLLYMSYRYAIGRHTIHSHAHACDILSNWYDRLKLSPNRMLFTSKDMNKSIEDIMRWSYNIYIDNYDYSKNIFPYELYRNVVKREIEKNGEFKQNRYKKIQIYVDYENNFIDYDIIWLNDDEKDNFYFDIFDLEIWNNVAKVLDLSTHHHAKITDDSIVEYVELYNADGTTYKALLPDYISNTYRVKLVTDEIVKEYID